MMSSLSVPAVHLDVEARLTLTSSCTDCDSIPKVWNAGQVVTENGLRVQIMHNGLKVVADGYCGSWMTRLIGKLRGHHEPQEEVVFHEVLKHVGATATMIELGGSWSYYSLWFLLGREERRAIVIEPDTWNISLGRRNARLNHAPILFEQACAGAEPMAEVSFVAERSGRISIPQVSVPSLMQQYDVSVLDLLHCDIRGAENEIIRSCETLFRNKRIKFALFATHSHHINGDPLTHQRCLAALQDFGATILAEHDVHEGFGEHGLIAAYAGAQELRWPPLQISRNRYSTSCFRNPLFDLAEFCGRPAARR